MPSFNSTLVQLNAECPDDVAELITVFQFHIGSIKCEGRVLIATTSYNLFQFHIGSIKWTYREPNNRLSCFVSIPHWFN